MVDRSGILVVFLSPVIVTDSFVAANEGLLFSSILTCFSGFFSVDSGNDVGSS